MWEAYLLLDFLVLRWLLLLLLLLLLLTPPPRHIVQGDAEPTVVERDAGQERGAGAGRRGREDAERRQAQPAAAGRRRLECRLLLERAVADVPDCDAAAGAAAGHQVGAERRRETLGGRGGGHRRLRRHGNGHGNVARVVAPD